LPHFPCCCEDYLEKGCTINSASYSDLLASNSHQTPRREAVHKWLRDQPKTFFVEGICKLVDYWTKCIEKEGDYVEKLRTCSTSTFV
jgi:hypothetical protein